MDDLIDALDAFVPQGSELHLYSEVFSFIACSYSILHPPPPSLPSCSPPPFPRADRLWTSKECNLRFG